MIQYSISPEVFGAKGFAVTVSIMLIVESQPELFKRFMICVPGEVKVKPFQAYGNSFSHIDRFIVLVSIPFTLKFNVTVESHPKVLETVVLCVPGELKSKPFQVYGSSFSHTDRLTVLVSIPFTLKFNVTIESHPKVFVSVVLCVPEDENV